MKIKLFTSNTDIAAVAACGGLTVMPMFPLFMETHGLRYSLVALIITLWGFLSLKQMDTEQDAPKPKKHRGRKIGLTMALIVFIGGGLLFGAIKMIDATQADQSPCVPQWPKLECIKEVGPQPICPNQKPPCSLGYSKAKG